MSDIRKIAVLRFSSLGDIVMVTPAVRALRRRFPNAQIDMVVREDFLDLIRACPHLNEKIGLPRDSGLDGLTSLRDRLNRSGYDLIYDAHRSLRTRLLMPQLNVKYKAFFDKHYLTRNLSLTLKLSWPKDAPRFLERFIEPLKPFGVQYDGLGPEVFIESQDYHRCFDKFPALKKDSPRIGLIPSAQWPGKRWPVERFRAVIERVIHETDFEILVLGGPSDEFCSDLIRDLPTDRIINTQGKLSIAESAAAIDQCSMVIANDTGLMHVADALGIPSVLIFGPTSADLGCLPFHPLTEVLEHQLWCRPCSKNGEAPCIRGKRVCLEKTTTEDVFSATLRLASRLSMLGAQIG